MVGVLGFSIWNENKTAILGQKYELVNYLPRPLYRTISAIKL